MAFPLRSEGRSLDAAILMSANGPRIMVICCPGLCWPGGMTPPSPPGLAGPGTAREFDQVLTKAAHHRPEAEQPRR